MSKPVAGQWYEWQEQRVYCVGQDSHGHTIVNNECGTLNILRGRLIEDLTHLPDCTGWDWQPETFPQYYKGLSGTFIRRDSADRTVSVNRDGTEHEWSSKFDSSVWDRISEAEALALLVRKPQPAEDPEEWVEITDPQHLLRECDEGNHKGNPSAQCISVTRDGWVPITSIIHLGRRVSDNPSYRFRCRRKDLPAKPKRTVTVPKWLVIDDQGLTFIIEQSEAPSGSSYIEVSKVGETTYEIEET